MGQITYGLAKMEDALRISILFKQVYIQTYATEGITVEFANFITQRFSPEYVASSIKNSPGQILVAYNDGNPIAVAELDYNATCSIGEIKAPELSKFYILERFYGQGIGIGLIEFLEKEVRLKGHEELWLVVYEKNSRAISFYQKQGYSPIGKVDFKMEFNTYKNHVLHKKLD